jgi:hypothetical protein
MSKFAYFKVYALTLAVIGAATGTAQAGSSYGCFRVTADQINIRERPYSNAAIIGTALKSAVLEKRKRWCTLRGYWCAVRSGNIEGYADKSFMEMIDCP